MSNSKNKKINNKSFIHDKLLATGLDIRVINRALKNMGLLVGSEHINKDMSLVMSNFNGIKKKYLPSNIIYDGFIWNSSPEGHDFWEGVNNYLEAIEMLEDFDDKVD